MEEDGEVMPSTTVVVFADTGGGHRSAANAIVEQLTEHAEPCELVNLSDIPTLRFLRRGYDHLCRIAPWLYRALFRITNHAWAVRVGSPLVAAAIATHPPSSNKIRNSSRVVILHPLFVAGAVAHLSRRRPTTPQVVSVALDPVSPHVGWAATGVKQICFSNQAARSLGNRGGAVRVLPPKAFPVGSAVDAVRPALRQPGISSMVYLPGRIPSRSLLHTCAILRKHCAELQVVTFGSTRQARLIERAFPEVTASAWLPASELMAKLSTASWVVSKAGPSVMAECAALGIQLVLVDEVGPQEFGNAEFGRENFDHIDRVGAPPSSWFEVEQRETKAPARSADILVHELVVP